MNFKEPEPQEPMFKGPFITVYKGRHYFDTVDGNNQGSLRAERDYLRDWKRWAEKEMGREYRI